MRAQEFGERAQEILSTVVRMHILSGAPVPSAEVARRQGGVSSATVRNVMADLEKSGFLLQPHTSAGRIPTAKAYAHYARQVAARARLQPGDRSRIDDLMAVGAVEPGELLARAPHALSELCHGVGLVLLPRLSQVALEEIRFMHLSPHRVLAVAVTKGGLVRNKTIRTRRRFSPDELERMSAYLNENFRGWTLAGIRREMERRVAAERDLFLRQALTLCKQGFDAGEEATELRLEGLAHLLEGGGSASPEVLRGLLQTLEDREHLAQLLSDCVNSPESSVRVMVGLEQLAPSMRDFTLIGARCGGGTNPPSGSLGLLGPTRMDYARAISAVRYVAALLDRALIRN